MGFGSVMSNQSILKLPWLGHHLRDSGSRGLVRSLRDLYLKGALQLIPLLSVINTPEMGGDHNSSLSKEGNWDKKG